MTIAGAFFLSACQWSSEQGPTNINSIQKAQKKGKHPTDEYQIIDVTKSNIAKHNKRQVTGSNAMPPMDPRKGYSDAVRPHDQLTLQVVDTADNGGFTGSNGRPAQFGPFEVPQTGRIVIPYAGEFSVLGKEIADIQSEIQKAYSTVFNSARVSLARTSRLPLRANVIGIARSPGQQVIDREGANLADLVAKAGGTTQEPFTCEYILHRNKHSYRLNNHDITTRNILAQDGDILEIRKSADRSVTLLGAVHRPGSYPFPNHESHLDDFIGEGSGFRSDSANVSGVFIFRKTSTGSTNIYRFNLRDPSGVIAAGGFLVHGNDIIYVTEAPLTRWNRTLRNILPFSQVSDFTRFTN